VERDYLMPYTPETWVDDDGSGTVGTLVTAARMNNIEDGIDAATDVTDLFPDPASLADSQGLAWDDASGLYLPVDIYTQAQVDSLLAGAGGGALSLARYATDSALPAHTVSGNTRTATANGALAVDGISTPLAGTLILVKNQATSTENGLYILTQQGTAGLPWILDRAPGWEVGDIIQTGHVVSVVAGDTNYVLWKVAGTSLSSMNNTVGTNGMTFNPASGITNWQSWVPTLTGWSSNPTNSVYRYMSVNEMVTLAIRQGTDGTSNAATATISLPSVSSAATITNMEWMAPAAVTDNGAFQSAPGRARIASGGSVLTLGKAWNADGGFTASGGKKVDNLVITYEKD
jgi:hypothetical protein